MMGVRLRNVKYQRTKRKGENAGYLKTPMFKKIARGNLNGRGGDSLTRK